MEISILIIRRAGQITFFKHVEIFDVLLIVEQYSDFVGTFSQL